MCVIVLFTSSVTCFLSFLSFPLLAKMDVMFTLIKASILAKDKVLVFTQSVITLDLIEKCLSLGALGESFKPGYNN